MKKLRYPLLLSAMMLAACGSDSDTTPGGDTGTPPETIPPVVTPPVNADYDNFDLKVDLNDPLEGKVYFYIGRWYECSEDRPKFCKNGDPATDFNVFTPNPVKHEMAIDLADLKRVMGKSINPKIADGQFTILDLMMYVSKVRDDFEITMSDFDEELGSYRFTTSFDFNGDGKFDIADKEHPDAYGEDNFNSPHWYPRFTYTGGDFKREIGPPTLEAMYERPQDFLLRPNTEIRYEPFTPLMTERREWVQKREVQRLADHDGKVVIEEVQVDFGDGAGYVTITEDIEVEHYNLRPDLFKDGVYTIADALMTAHNDPERDVDIGYTIWPTLSTNSNVDAYAITSVQGQRAYGFHGWLMYTGEKASARDFFASMTPLTVDDVKFGQKCTWITDEDYWNDNNVAQQCFDDFYNMFGGNMLHHMSDTWVIDYPHEVVQLKWSAQNGLWKVKEHHYADGQYPWYDISKAVAPMDETHFGWGIADCSQCHSVDKIHLDGDSPYLPDTAEPHYCAQCHGSNGAPKGHGEEARCHWCHSRDQRPVNHGGQSLLSQVQNFECQYDIGEGLGKSGPCANYPAPGAKIAHDKANNFGPYYEGTMKTTSNNDWNMDSQFTDPYSCITCHPNDSMDVDSAAN